MLDAEAQVLGSLLRRDPEDEALRKRVALLAEAVKKLHISMPSQVYARSGSTTLPFIMGDPVDEHAAQQLKQFEGKNVLLASSQASSSTERWADVADSDGAAPSTPDAGFKPAMRRRKRKKRFRNTQEAAAAD